MKTSIVINWLIVTLSAASATWAGNGFREDNSNVFVWVFLGLCASIVVTQLLPAMLLLFGFAKGISRKKSVKEADENGLVE